MPTSRASTRIDASIKRVLIYRLGSLGDTLVALPSLHLIARAFPNAERRMLTNFPVHAKAPAAAAILEGSGLVHGYLSYTVGTRSPRALLALWARIARWRPQVVVYLAAPRGPGVAERDAQFFKLCGNPAIVGLPLSQDLQKNRLLADGTLEPEGERLARTIADLGDAEIDTPAAWDLSLTPAEHLRAAAALESLRGTGEKRPVLGVSVGTKVQAKDWGRQNWQALLARISRQYPSHTLALTGAPEEAEASAYAAEGWQSARPQDTRSVVNLCGLLTPRESAAVFARCQIFLGHDSGPMHLAAAVQTPCVAIFAARNIPRVWFPNGSRHRIVYHQVSCAGCGLETCIEELKRCLTSITVEEVFSAVEAAIHDTSAASAAVL